MKKISRGNSKQTKMCSVSIIAIFQSLFRTVIILTARYVMRITKITWNT